MSGWGGVGYWGYGIRSNGNTRVRMKQKSAALELTQVTIQTLIATVVVLCCTWFSLSQRLYGSILAQATFVDTTQLRKKKKNQPHLHH